MVFNALLAISGEEKVDMSGLSLTEESLDEKYSHRSYGEIKELIGKSSYGESAKMTALLIYGVIAKAESTVHGTEMEDIHFHEVGRNQAIENIMGISVLLEKLEIDGVRCSPIHDGKGFVQCSHGKIPVPVPAVMAMRDHCDYTFVIDDVETEMVTPSGLGILLGIGARPVSGMPRGEVLATAEVKGQRNTGKGGLTIVLVQSEEEEKMEAKPVKNTELIEAIKNAKENPSQENTVTMLNQVVKARLLAPISLDRPPVTSGEDGEVVLEKDTQVSFEMIKATNGDLYYPVFTHGPEMKKCATEKDQHSLIVNFQDLANMVLNQEKEIKGFVIDPLGQNICFTSDMIKGMLSDMKSEDKNKDMN